MPSQCIFLVSCFCQRKKRPFCCTWVWSPFWMYAGPLLGEMDMEKMNSTKSSLCSFAPWANCPKVILWQLYNPAIYFVPQIFWVFSRRIFLAWLRVVTRKICEIISPMLKPVNFVPPHPLTSWTNLSAKVIHPCLYIYKFIQPPHSAVFFKKREAKNAWSSIYGEICAAVGQVTGSIRPFRQNKAPLQ